MGAVCNIFPSFSIVVPTSRKGHRCKQKGTTYLETLEERYGI